MSGLETLAALGLVCNVFQIISFTGELYTTCTRLFKGETPDANLSSTLNHLNAVLGDIMQSIISAPQPLSENDKALFAIAQECKAAATALGAELDQFSATTATGKKWKSIKLGTKHALTLKKRYEELEKILQRNKSALETRLWHSVCTKTEAANIRQRKDFDQLDLQLRNLVTAIADGELRMTSLLIQQADSIRDHVTTEASSIRLGHDAIRSHVTAETTKLKTAIFDEAKDQKLLKSVKYGSLNERRNQIRPPAANTFKWIFGQFEKGDDDFEDDEDDHGDYGDGDDSNNDTNSTNDDSDDADSDEDEDGNKEFHKLVGDASARQEASACFLSWLQSPDQSLFWISGKPGSGKSTLMKFVSKHPKTLKGLRVSGKKTVVLSHFIWTAGQPMERRIKGVLCSLVHQLLQSVSELAAEIISRYSWAARKDKHSDWDEQELKKVLKLALQNPSVVFCIFLDGLDEIDAGLSEGQQRLLDLVKELQTLQDVKLCVASRPEPLLKSGLSHVPMFRIHELTQWDIWRFASRVLNRRFGQLTGSDKTPLLKSVCEMADGVFLWVALALKSLETGLHKGDKVWELKRRLTTLPRDLKDLYAAMWKRLGDDEAIYRRDAAVYLNSVLACQLVDDEKPLAVGELQLSLDPNRMKQFRLGRLQAKELGKALSNKWEGLARQLEVRCAGLLEITRNDRNPLFSTIAFIHRSAKEFLEESEEGQNLLRGDSVSKSRRVVTIAQAILVAALLLPEVLKSSLGSEDHSSSGRRSMCETPASFFRKVQTNYQRKYDISRAQAVEILSFLEDIMNSWPSSRIEPWIMVPWVDFVGIAASERAPDLVQSRLKEMDDVGQVSPEYNTYLLTAALSNEIFGPDGEFELDMDMHSGSEDSDSEGGRGGFQDGKPKVQSRVILFQNLTATLDLLLARKVDPNLRTFQFSRPNISGDTYAAVHITPIEAAAKLLLAAHVTQNIRSAIASVIDRLLTMGVDLSKPTVLAICPVHGKQGFFEFGSQGLSALGSENGEAMNGELFVMTNIATLLGLAVRTLYKDHVSDVKSTLKRLRRTKFQVNCITWESPEGDFFETTDVKFSQRMAVCLESMVVADYGEFRLDGFHELVEDMENHPTSQVGSKSVEGYVSRDIFWRWDDQRTRRPQRYADRLEPLQDLSIQTTRFNDHLKWIVDDSELEYCSSGGSGDGEDANDEGDFRHGEDDDDEDEQDDDDEDEEDEDEEDDDEEDEGVHSDRSD